MEKRYILNSSLWPAPTVVPPKIFQYLATIEFTCDTSTLGTAICIAGPCVEKKTAYITF